MLTFLQIIPEAGFESTPADLLSWALVSAIREKMSTGTEEVILSVHELKYEPMTKRWS